MEIVRSHSNKGFILLEGVISWVSILLLIASLYAAVITATKYTHAIQKECQTLLEHHHNIKVYYSHNHEPELLRLSTIKPGVQKWEYGDNKGRIFYGFKFK